MSRSNDTCDVCGQINSRVLPTSLIFTDDTDNAICPSCYDRQNPVEKTMGGTMTPENRARKVVEDWAEGQRSTPAIPVYELLTQALRDYGNEQLEEAAEMTDRAASRKRDDGYRALKHFGATASDAHFTEAMGLETRARGIRALKDKSEW